MAQKKFAVIGSNCFTGSHIVDALIENPDNQVIGISRSPEYKDFFLPYKRHPGDNFRFHQFDVVRDFDEIAALLDRFKPEYVINVAALSEVGISNDQPVEYFAVNATSVVRLCNHLRRTSYLGQYIHISSAEVFGANKGQLDEDAFFNPTTPYAVSKAAADMFLYSLMKNFDFPATLIRSTNVYGKHQQLFKIIPRTVIYHKLEKTIELHGGGKSIKSFIHIRDVVNGLMLTIEKKKAGTFHFSVPDDEMISGIVRRVCERLGADFGRSAKVVGERLGQDPRYWLDCSRAVRELGWEPKISFEDGVDEVIEWVEANWAEIQKEPLEYIHKV